MMSDFRPYHNCSPIGHVESLAKHLGVSTGRLVEMANDSAAHWRAGPDLKKPNGEIRHTHSATRELKDIHARVKNKILRKTHYPNFLYGSLPKTLERGVRSHIDNAALHADRRLIISADIKGYFPSISETVVHGIWRGFYPFSPEVAEILTKLTTYQDQAPQGWACSSYLAQLVFYDSEHEVVEHFLAQDMLYTRLTDDVTLSTNRTLTKNEITEAISSLNRMLNRKRTRINRSKTRVDSTARRQSVNKINVSAGEMTLSKKYRKSVRAKIHRLATAPETFGDNFNREIQSANGKVSYIGNFHKKLAKNLRLQLKQVENTQRKYLVDRR